MLCRRIQRLRAGTVVALGPNALEAFWKCLLSPTYITVPLPVIVLALRCRSARPSARPSVSPSVSLPVCACLCPIVPRSRAVFKDRAVVFELWAILADFKNSNLFRFCRAPTSYCPFAPSSSSFCPPLMLTPFISWGMFSREGWVPEVSISFFSFFRFFARVCGVAAVCGPCFLVGGGWVPEVSILVFRFFVFSLVCAGWRWCAFRVSSWGGVGSHGFRSVFLFCVVCSGGAALAGHRLSLEPGGALPCKPC